MGIYEFLCPLSDASFALRREAPVGHWPVRYRAEMSRHTVLIERRKPSHQLELSVAEDSMRTERRGANHSISIVFDISLNDSVKEMLSRFVPIDRAIGVANSRLPGIAFGGGRHQAPDCARPCECILCIESHDEIVANFRKRSSPKPSYKEGNSTNAQER